MLGVRSMQQRSLATRRVMKTVARRAVEQPLPVRLSDGTFPIIVTLPDDTVVSVGDRVRKVGGRANVFVAFSTDLALVEFLAEATAGEGGSQIAHEDTSMAMFVELLKLHPGESCNITISRNVSASAPSVRSLAYAF